MKKTRLMILFGLILCLLLAACAAFAEGETPAETGEDVSAPVVMEGFTLEFPWEGNTSECVIADADDSLIQNGILVLPEKIGDYDIRGYRISLFSDSKIRILVSSSNYGLYKENEEAPDSKLEYYVITYKNFFQLSEREFDRAPDIQKGEYALTEFYRQVINRNGKTDNSWSDENLLLEEEIPKEIFGAKAYNLIDPMYISRKEGNWVYSIREYNGTDSAFLLAYDGPVEKNFVIPDTLAGLPVYGYYISVIPAGVEYVYIPDNISLYMSNNDGAADSFEFIAVRYLSYQHAAEDRQDMIRTDSSFTEGTYAVVYLSRWIVSGNNQDSNSIYDPIPADSLLAEINGSPLSLGYVADSVSYTEGDWQYTRSRGDEAASLIGYTGSADSSFVVPETVAGLDVKTVYLSAVPSGVEYLYIPYGAYMSNNRSNLAAGEKRSIVLISYVSYAKAGDYSSSLYQTEGFTEGSYIGTDIHRWTYSNTGSDSEYNAVYPADILLNEINGAPFVPGNISRYIAYVSGDYTYTLSNDGDLCLLNGVPTDRENALFVPSYVEGKRVRNVSFTELPENITEIYIPYSSYIYNFNSPLTHDLYVYSYIDSEAAENEYKGWSNVNVQPGELLLYGANVYKTNGNSEQLVQDSFLYPSEINSLTIRNGLNSGYIKTYTSGNYTYYKLSESEICICGFSDTEARKVNIPETIDDLTVTAISSLDYTRVFDVSKAEEITLPSTLKILGNYALYSWSSKKLNKLILPEGLKEIGTQAVNLYYLKELTIPASVERLGSQAFAYTNIKKITIPGSVKVIPSNLFLSCYYLGAVTLSEGTTTIEEEAFYGRRIKSINIPASVTSIGKNAFNSCSKLGKVTFAGTGITKIEDGTFADCTGLSKIDLPEGVESIGYQAFYGTKLGQLTLPSTLKEIGSAAFGSCKSLTKVIAGTGLESIAKDAFQDCRTKLTFYSSEGSYVQQWAESNGFVFKPSK